MKTVEVLKADEVEVKPFRLNDFTHNREKKDRIEKISKKTLKNLAKKMGLEYSDTEIQNIKNLLETYLVKRTEER